MPIISFTEKDLLRGTVVEPAWYRLKIENIGEALSKDKNSTNYPVEATIIANADNGDARFANVPIEWNFNSKALGFTKGFLAAFGVELKPGVRFDLANAAGKELDVFIENKEYEGRIINNVPHKYRTPRTA